MTTIGARCTREIEFSVPREKQHSTRRRLFSPANWTES